MSHYINFHQFLHQILLVYVKPSHFLSISWCFLIIILCFCAPQVLYDTIGFLEKNRDPLHSDSLHLLMSCNSPLLQQFASSMVDQSQKSTGPNVQSALDNQKRSVATKFKVIILCCCVHLIISKSLFLYLDYTICLSILSVCMGVLSVCRSTRQIETNCSMVCPYPLKLIQFQCHNFILYIILMY